MRFAVHRGQHYFIITFVEGRSFAEEIRDGKSHFSTARIIQVRLPNVKISQGSHD